MRGIDFQLIIKIWIGDSFSGLFISALATIPTEQYTHGYIYAIEQSYNGYRLAILVPYYGYRSSIGFPYKRH